MLPPSSQFWSQFWSHWDDVTTRKRFCALLTLREFNPLVIGGFPSQSAELFWCVCLFGVCFVLFCFIINCRVAADLRQSRDVNVFWLPLRLFWKGTHYGRTGLRKNRTGAISIGPILVPYSTGPSRYLFADKVRRAWCNHHRNPDELHFVCDGSGR